MKINPLTAIDFYKADHISQYPEGTTEVYSNFTARSAKYANLIYDDPKVILFGLQYFIKEFLIETWNAEFFEKDKREVVSKYKKRLDSSLGIDAVGMKHIEALHDLGYLPILVKSLPEGSRVNIGVPLFTIVNTNPDFFWLTNYIESVVSCYMWKPITNATIAFEYKRLLTEYAIKTGSPLEFVDFQAHDFSFRGMSSIQDSMISGAAHLTSFSGTDTVSSLDLVDEYYGGTAGYSVPATEHSVMCMGKKLGEFSTFVRLIENVYPSGIVSIVSDTWDFWKVITEFMPALKDLIMSRDGKVVIRPDSGCPVKIICGDDDAEEGSPERKGAIECLFEIFGGTITDTGHRLLDSHIGLIYGDSITLNRCNEIMKRLSSKGFASGNVVLGIGSFTYQYSTRDTFGFAMKATSGVVDGVRRDIFKDPKTDDGIKRSAKGLLRVEMKGGEYVLHDEQQFLEEQSGELKPVFMNGEIITETSFHQIKSLLDEKIKELSDERP